MKKLYWLITIISIIINGGLVYIFIIKGSTIPSDDDRIAVVLTSSQKDFALTEMRGFLESVQEINQGIINNNTDKIIAAANKSGGSVIEHAPEGMVGRLPLGFKKLGFGVHDLFDELAVTTKEEFNPKKIQQQLNTILISCVTCHKGYKIVVGKNVKI